MYHIGEFSHLMGIRADTLRYYDECGLLKPVIDKQNKYRVYTQEDAIRLLHIRNCRQMEMPIKEIGEMMRGQPLDMQSEQLEKKSRYLEQEIERLQLLKQRCDAVKKSIGNVKQNLGKIVELHCKPAYHLMINSLAELDKDSARELVGKWINILPFAGYFVALRYDSLFKGKFELELGISASLRYVGEFNLPIQPPVMQMLGGPGLQYTIAVESLFDLTIDDFAPALEYVKKRNKKVTDDICLSIEAIEYRENKPPLHYVQLRFPMGDETPSFQ